MGESGILPAGRTLEAAGRQLAGWEALWRVPTVCWWVGAGDAVLTGLCWVGIAASLLLTAGRAPRFCLIAVWVSYLSLVSVGQRFLGYQWDALVLEAAFCAFWLAPWTHRGLRDGTPSLVGIWMVRLLTVKLLFSSGAVKLASGDETWRGLTALTVHYETTPLPVWIGWWVHQAPVWFHKAATALALGIELAGPWLIFGPRRVRGVGFGLQIGLQLAIALTGNYGFFNLLAAALCLSFLDDQCLPRRLRRPRAGAPVRRRAGWGAPIGAAVVFLLYAGMAADSMVRAAGGPGLERGPLQQIRRGLAPFRTVNPYGLFASMTTSRPEILVQASRDGEQWVTIPFKWKPGAPDEAPRFVAPHMPRLDWQMWFAALGHIRGNRWLIEFMARLAQEEAAVLDLIERWPFAEGEPPTYFRAVMMDYTFTSAAERRATGHWWTRSNPRAYSPVLQVRRNGNEE